jgi:hypothetical protein
VEGLQHFLGKGVQECMLSSITKCYQILFIIYEPLLLIYQWLLFKDIGFDASIVPFCGFVECYHLLSFENPLVYSTLINYLVSVVCSYVTQFLHLPYCDRVHSISSRISFRVLISFASFTSAASSMSLDIIRCLPSSELTSKLSKSSNSASSCRNWSCFLRSMREWR